MAVDCINAPQVTTSYTAPKDRYGVLPGFDELRVQNISKPSDCNGLTFIEVLINNLPHSITFEPGVGFYIRKDAVDMTLSTDLGHLLDEEKEILLHETTGKLTEWAKQSPANEQKVLQLALDINAVG
jgi:hypothetical protein